jgi:hypothetical protein
MMMKFNTSTEFTPRMLHNGHMSIDSRGGLDEDEEEYDEETEEVLIDSQKGAASDDLAE